jgi:spectrin beta
MAQEPYLQSKDLGETLEETLALLKKHLAFERAAATQEERFLALQRLTTLELKAKERTPETEAARRAEKERRIAEAIREFQPPPVVPVQPVPPSHEMGHPQVGVTVTEQVGQPSSVPSTPKRGRESKDTGRPPARDFEGTLVRKHEWQSGGKKAPSRSWHELYFVASTSSGTLSAYKDERMAKEKPGELYRHELPVTLAGASAAPAFNYSKRRFVFRLKAANGGETLFQAPSAELMHEWIEVLNAIIATLPSVPTESLSGPGGRAATLPPGAAPESQTPSTSVAQKKKFFTLGRKK